MATSIYPGVFIEEAPDIPPEIQPAATALPAFIGYTEKAANKAADDLKLVPCYITSLSEYETFFGAAEPEKNIEVTITDRVDAAGNIMQLSAKAAFASAGSSKHNMYYALQLYYANGGGPCYIVSAGNYTDTIYGERFAASALQQGLDVLATVAGPTLIVIPEGQYIDKADNYYTLQQKALAQCASVKNRLVIVDVYDTTSDITGAIAECRNHIGTAGLMYGAAYYPNLITSLLYSYNEADVTVKHIRIINGAVPVNGPFHNSRLNDVRLKQNGYDVKARQAIAALPVIMPPGAAIAGVYAASDAEEGVWKAPANRALNKVKGTTIPISNSESEQFNIDVVNGKSVNTIRTFAGKGILVWGARTLAGNDHEWRYVAVRRLFNMVEASVKEGIAFITFEPNEAAAWSRARAIIERFLTVLWQQGALAGTKMEEAFFVRVGLGQTMTAQDIANGTMNIEIGMAILRPAEFIILRLSLLMQ